MKKYILFLSLFAGVALSSVAQSTPGGRFCKQDTCRASLRDKTRTRGMEVCGIQNSLSEEDRKKFQTLHESYQKDMAAIREKYPCAVKQKGVCRTEEQQDECMKNRLAAKKAIADLQSEYYTKFRKILTPRQTAQVLGMDRDKSRPSAPSKQKQQGKRQCCQGK